MKGTAMPATESATLAAVLPPLAHWLTPQQVAEQLGVRHLLVLSWINGGVKGPSGWVRLAAKKLGGRWRIDPAAVSAFVDATTADALGETAPPPPTRQQARKKKQLAEAFAELRAMGMRV